MVNKIHVVKGSREKNWILPTDNERIHWLPGAMGSTSKGKFEQAGIFLLSSVLPHHTTPPVPFLGTLDCIKFAIGSYWGIDHMDFSEKVRVCVYFQNISLVCNV